MIAPIHSHITSGETINRNVAAHGCWTYCAASWRMRWLRSVHSGEEGASTRAWVAAGLPTSSGPVYRTPANFHATLDREGIRDFPQMQQLIAGRGQILDARSAGRFTGAAPEPRSGISSGHMPGATSIPYTELVADGRLKSVEQLHKVFEATGVDLKQPITTTCGSGVTAAVIALGLEIAGADRVSLYDGSWAEYAQHPEAVIEKT